ncbi:hypothetical protein ABPG74_008245 [Tetrahymena malaccensis]
MNQTQNKVQGKVKFSINNLNGIGRRQSFNYKFLLGNQDGLEDEDYKRYKKLQAPILKQEFENQQMKEFKSLNIYKQQQILAQQKKISEFIPAELKNILDDMIMANKYKEQEKDSLLKNLDHLKNLQDDDDDENEEKDPCFFFDKSKSMGSLLFSDKSSQSLFQNLNEVGLLNVSRSIKHQQYNCHQKYMEVEKPEEKMKATKQELKDQLINLKQSIERIQILQEREISIHESYHGDFLRLDNSLKTNEKRLYKLQQEQKFFEINLENFDNINPKLLQNLNQAQTELHKMKKVQKKMAELEKHNIDYKEASQNLIKKEIEKEQEKILRLRFVIQQKQLQNERLMKEIEYLDDKEQQFKERQNQQLTLFQYLKCFSKIHQYFMNTKLNEHQVVKLIQKEFKSSRHFQERIKSKKSKLLNKKNPSIHKLIKKKSKKSINDKHDSISMKKIKAYKKKQSSLRLNMSMQEIAQSNALQIKKYNLHRKNPSLEELDSEEESSSFSKIFSENSSQSDINDPFNFKLNKKLEQNSLVIYDDFFDFQAKKSQNEPLNVTNSNLQKVIKEFESLVNNDLEAFSIQAVNVYNRIFIQNRSLNSQYEILNNNVYKKKHILEFLDKEIHRQKQEDLIRLEAIQNMQQIIDSQQVSMDSGIIKFKQQNVTQNNSSLDLQSFSQIKLPSSHDTHQYLTRQNIQEQTKQQEKNNDFLTVNEVNFNQKNYQSELIRIAEKNQIYERFALSIYYFLNEYSYRVCQTTKLLIVNSGLVPHNVQVKFRNLSQILGKKHMKLFIPNYRNDGDDMYNSLNSDSNVQKFGLFGKNKSNQIFISDLVNLKNSSITTLFDIQSSMRLIKGLPKGENQLLNLTQSKFSRRQSIKKAFENLENQQNNDHSSIESKAEDKKSTFSFKKNQNQDSENKQTVRCTTPTDRNRKKLDDSNDTSPQKQDKNQKFSRRNTKNKTLIYPKATQPQQNEQPQNKVSILPDDLKYEIDMPEWNQIVSLQKLSEIAQENSSIIFELDSIQLIYNTIKSDRFVGYFLNQEKLIEYFKVISSSLTGSNNKRRLSIKQNIHQDQIEEQMEEKIEIRSRSTSYKIQGEKQFKHFQNKKNQLNNQSDLIIDTQDLKIKANKFKINEKIIENFYLLKNFAHQECISHIKLIIQTLKELFHSLSIQKRKISNSNTSRFTKNEQEQKLESPKQSQKRQENSISKSIHCNNKFIQTQINNASKKIHQYFNSDQQKDFKESQSNFFEFPDALEQNKQPEEYITFIKNAEALNLQSKNKSLTEKKIKQLVRKTGISKPQKKIKLIQLALMPLIKKQVNKLMSEEIQMEEQRSKLKQMMTQYKKAKEKLKDQIKQNEKIKADNNLELSRLGKTQNALKKQFPQHLYRNVSNERYPTVKLTLQNSQVINRIDKLNTKHPVKKRSSSQESILYDGVNSILRIVREKKNILRTLAPLNKKGQNTDHSSSSSGSSNFSQDEEEDFKKRKSQSLKAKLNQKIELNEIKDNHFYLKAKYKSSIQNRLLVPLSLNMNSNRVSSNNNSVDIKTKINKISQNPLETLFTSQQSSPKSNIYNKYQFQEQRFSINESEKYNSKSSTFYDNTTNSINPNQSKIQQITGSKQVSKLPNNLSFQMLFKTYCKEKKVSNNMLSKYFPNIK